MPKGYIVAELYITNPGPGFEAYRAKVGATVEAFGGRFLARGGAPTLLEGDHPAGRMVILEFDTPERAMEWYKSAAYQQILPLRLDNAPTRAICASGT